MQHLGIPLEDLSRRRQSTSSQGSDVSDRDGILGVFSQADTSVLSDWLPPGQASSHEHEHESLSRQSWVRTPSPAFMEDRGQQRPESSHNTGDPHTDPQGQGDPLENHQGGPPNSSVLDSPRPPPRVRQYSTLEAGRAFHYEPELAAESRTSLVSELGPRPLGRSCFLFGASNKFRRNLFWMTRNVWYHRARIVLSIAQTVVLAFVTIRGSSGSDDHGPGQPTAGNSFKHWETVFMLLLYIFFTFHVIASIIAQGLFTFQIITWQDIKSTFKKRFEATRNAVLDSTQSINEVLIHDDMGEVEEVLAKDREDQREDELLIDQAFMRKSWSRVELISVIFYWLSMPANAVFTNVPSMWQMFYGMSNLRIFWLLSLWPATQVIYHSLKIAFPLLTDVLIFLALSALAFSVAGLQSFSGSLSRTCVWVDPLGLADNYTSSQVCGSYIDPRTREIMPYLDRNGQNTLTVKGFTCPLNSYCVEGQSEQDGTLNFDNIFNAIEIVFIVMSNNTYSDIMYSIINAEQAASCLFFVFGVFVLNYWMLSLLVSVLSSSFDIAWAARPQGQKQSKLVEKASTFFGRGENFVKTLQAKPLGRRYLAVYPIFSILIVLDVIFQAIYSPRDDDIKANDFLYYWQIFLSGILLAEIFVRFALYGTRWKAFFGCPMNIFDLVLAIINMCTIWIYNSQPLIYAWMTFFQLLRFYRFVGLFPAGERMLKMLLGNFEQLWKLTAFYFVITLIAAMLVCRMYLGQLPYNDPESGDTASVSFFNLSNAFMAMYQISSTENWTDVMYYVVENSESLIAKACTAALFCIWLTFSNFIVVNLFISVMSGGFQSSLKNCRQQQVRRFVHRSLKGKTTTALTRVPPVIKRAMGRVRHGFLGKQVGDLDEQENPLDAIGKVAEKELLAEFLKLSESEDLEDENSTKVPTIFSHFNKTGVMKSILGIGKRFAHLWNREANYQRHVKESAKWRKRTDKLNKQRQRFVHDRNRSDLTIRTDTSFEKELRPTTESPPVVPKPVRLNTSVPFAADVLDDVLLTPQERAESAGSGSANLHAGERAAIVANDASSPSSPPVQFREPVRPHLNHTDSNETTLQRSSNDSSDELPIPIRRDETRDYLDDLFSAHQRHETQNFERSKTSPNYEKSLYLFSSDSKIRRFCQRITPPGHGVRLSGIEPNRWVWGIFWAITFLASVAVVIVSCINTPIYHIQHTKDLQRQASSWTWITYLDLIFTCMFFIEFMIKVIADGFHFTPNAYTYSPWNVIDMLVLMSMVVTVVNNFLAGPVSRYSRAIMAFRALRLISVNPNSEEVFTAMFFSGIGRIFVAAIIGLAVVFPYSVWGLNLFHGQLDYCVDSSIDNLSECYNEYLSSPYDWDVWAPRYVTKPYFNYDSFGEAMLIQFGVLSLEGWIDVLDAVTSIQGTGLSANAAFATMVNALYPILYNFIGTVLIMTMFLSTIIRNYAMSRITAYLTPEQLTWHYMKRTLRELRPKMQLPLYPVGTMRKVLLESIVNPKSIFNLSEIGLIGLLTIIYVLYHTPMSPGASRAYALVVSVLALIYVTLMGIKAWILGWRVFCSDKWNPFTLGTTLMLAAFSLATINGHGGFVVGMQRASALFSIALWTPKIPPVRRLFRAATINVAELVTITNTYFILFLAFAIAFNQTFGITKLGETGDAYQNFRSVPNALILLFKMSTGEGWNQILVDYKLSSPYCTAGSMFFESDCGSKPAATILFIAWNIISMYVFANLFISVIYDTFWYLYRRTQLSVTSTDLKLYQRNWQRYDPFSKGHILSEDFYKFLRTSKGYFSLGIYSDDPDYNLRAIIERSGCRRSHLNRYDVDYEAINRYLAHMPAEKFQQKRRLFELFCQHTFQEMGTGDIKKKIKFQKLLLQFPLYKDMDPTKVMELTEFIELKVELYQIKLVLATNFIRRRWRLRKGTLQQQRKIPALNIVED